MDLIVKSKTEQSAKVQNKGSILGLVVLAIFILTVLGLGVLSISYGARLRSANARSEAMAKLACEAGYEKAIYWLNSQQDVLSVFASEGAGSSKIKKPKDPNKDKPEGQGSFGNSKFDYSIRFDHFQGSRPVYKILSNGYCGLIKRTVEAFVAQAIGGWDMGMCRIPRSSFRTTPVYFTSDEVIDIPININCYTFPRDRLTDIHISRSNRPRFAQKVSMGESRHKLWGRNKDKYTSIMDVFEGGIYFDHPDSRITSPNALAEKVKRFGSSTATTFDFSGRTRKKPTVSFSVPGAVTTAAVQLEFYVDRSIGMVKITNNCTVCCTEGGSYDYKCTIHNIIPYEKYPIYHYHYASGSNSDVKFKKVEQSYVQQKVKISSSAGAGTEKKADSGGQIYIDGNVIIGGQVRYNNITHVWEINIGNNNWYPGKVKGKITVVATGNIWIVSPVIYEGPQETTAEGFTIPASGNENVLGLFSQYGVVKVVDSIAALDGKDKGHPGEYKPIGVQSTSQLPEPMIVQAAVTAGRGSWGAENVDNRPEKVTTCSLVFAGAITEVIRGLVANPKGENGFKKYYYFDKRLAGGILPGDMWLQSKFIPVPGGWSDYRQ